MTILQKLMTSLRFLPFKSSPKTHGLIFTSWVSEKKNGVIPKHVPIGRTDRPKFIRPFQPRSRVQNVRKKPSSFPADIIYEFMRIRHRMGAKLRNIFEYFLHWNNTRKKWTALWTEKMRFKLHDWSTYSAMPSSLRKIRFLVFPCLWQG